MDRLIKLQENLDHLRAEAAEVLAEVSDKLRSNVLSLPDMVDIGFLCREIATVLDDWRKDSTAHMTLASKVIGFKYARAAVQDEDIPDSIRGKLATGTPDAHILVTLPKKGTPEYETLCETLGVTTHDLSKLDFKAVQKSCNQLAAEGRPLPNGVGETYSEFVVSYRRK